MEESDKQLALRTLREALQDPATRPADKLRAAEAILRADSDALDATADTDALSDQALLLIARGGGTPPERGPDAPRAAAVPSRAPAHPTSPTDAREAASPERESSVVSDVPRETQSANPFLRRGPKEDPSFRVPGGIPLAMGPKEDPDPWT